MFEKIRFGVTLVPPAETDRRYRSTIDESNDAMTDAIQLSFLQCRIPDDSIPFSRWPLFFAREVLGEVVDSLKEKKGEEDGTSFAQECP
ncbi:MAG: hypothetical protein LBU11_05250, partial [Zoogloeaceae bacterium]|nr:hypothetical protein [Zoogloeaceae bacterium]